MDGCPHSFAPAPALSHNSVLTVSGDGSPSPNGRYYQIDDVGGKDAYARMDDKYFIYFDIGEDEYRISEVLGQEWPCWYNMGTTDLEGTYSPDIDRTGNPVVTLD
jgi:hypothetical protein